MSNNRNKNKMNPTRINNYNKFLCTLDEKAKTNVNLKVIETRNVFEKNDQCKQIDEILDAINNSYINNYSSPNFNGQLQNDCCCINNIEPNYYSDNTNKKLSAYYVKSDILQNNPSVCIIESITIDTEVNNITDILNLIDKYKNDPAIKYNINMKSLHDIKEPLEELNNMIGMVQLKNSIVDQIIYFIQEFNKCNHPSSGDFMHTVIYGPPGTGKTEIAKIMGKIFSKIGLLNNGTFKKVTRSDLIAGYLGQTSLKTRDVIKDSLGGVLFIDEAYALGNPDKKDSFSKECIDTLCEALSDNKDNLMVIVAGYEKELKESFFSFNQGLDSRFTWRFKTDDYSGEDLYNIFLKKVKDIGWEIDTNSKISVEWFKKNKEYFKFYGRDIETVLAKTKIAHSRRVFCLPESEKKKINLKDLDKGFEIYINNDDVKNRKDEIELKKQLYSSLYS